mmetsp:Transcript_54149/g.105956  ORF Transcript_54149/g.105956 Transcript_54149/m.105956 type:complete len:109 (+) Transcript_54149:300-626(+)
MSRQQKNRLRTSRQPRTDKQTMSRQPERHAAKGQAGNEQLARKTDCERAGNPTGRLTANGQAINERAGVNGQIATQTDSEGGGRQRTGRQAMNSQPDRHAANGQAGRQ